MKFIILLALFALNINAEPYRVKSFDGEKGITTLDVTLLEGWKISKTETEHGDYLVSQNKSVYFLGTYLKGQVNDDNKPLALADFEQKRKNNKSIKVSIDGVDIYYITRKNDTGLENYTFSRFISTGNVIHASMYPYPEFKTKSLDKEKNDIIKMLSKAIFPSE